MKSMSHLPSTWRNTCVWLALIFSAHVVAAPTFTVNSTLDQPDDLSMPGTCHTAANTCTLRAAIMQANRSSGVGATIILPAGPPYVLTIPAAGADGEENGDLNLTTPANGNPVINIVGAGADTTIIDGNQIDRVFAIHSQRTASISGVTIRNGYVTTVPGGGIANAGTLTVSHCTISQNIGLLGGGIQNVGLLTLSNSTLSGNGAFNGWGGGISTYNYLTVSSSTFSGNTALRGGAISNISGLLILSGSIVSGNSVPFDGGGIYNLATLEVGNSTFSSNLASFGGAIKSDRGTATVTGSALYGNAANFGGAIMNGAALFVVNSTINRNDADTDGGGIYNFTFDSNMPAAANVYNTSIVFNGADADADPTGGSGGGVYNDDASNADFNLRNTLIAGNNVSGLPVYDDCTGTLHSYGRNLFWDVSGCTVVTNSGAWGYLSSLGTLGPLQDNGGPTQTVALLPGSNAIDGGDSVFGCTDYNGNSIPTDQRGYARVSGTYCDVGAYEYSDRIFKNGFE